VSDEHPPALPLAIRLASLLDRQSISRPARIYRRAEAVLIIVGLLAMIVGTSRGLTPTEQFVASSTLLAIMLLFVLDVVARIILTLVGASVQRRRHHDDDTHWAGRVWGILDILTVLPMALVALYNWTPTGAPLLASLWLLRFGRYSGGGRMLATVLVREREPILGVLLMFAIVLTTGAVLGYLAERQAQPEVFTSVGAALWWTITTLTTTGYGDMAPVTLPGRLLGGSVMVGGVITISLLAGILATGFSAELKRTEFLRSWDMIAKVSFFENAGAAVIADVAALLRPRDFPSRSVVLRRGQPGDCMYFIVEGEVEILISPRPVRLGPGEFFGEMALLTGAPRNATIVTTKATQLLSLDIADFRALAASRPELTDIIKREAELRMGSGQAQDPSAQPAA
jgi:voltage-gated potassium channel